jgi:hypothetical protein
MGKFGLFDQFAYRLYEKRRGILANNRAARKGPLAELTREEKALFKSVWPNCDPVSYRFYKGFGLPFDTHYVPNDYYDFAEHVLNLRWGAMFLQHKCNLKFLIPSSHRPSVILQKIDGHYLLDDNTEITLEDAERILKEKDSFIRKIAIGSGGGRGVVKVSWDEVRNPKALLEELLQPEDLVIQEIIQQSSFMASFNPDSVNTFRLLTLNINGKCTLLSSFLRMGTAGAYVDNLCSGGVLVGIKQDGSLHDYGIKKDYSRASEAPSGKVFHGVTIPMWDEIKREVLELHRQIPYANLIGWDVTVDQDDQIIIVEINLDSAEIEAHQVFNGPVFGDRFDEIRQYIDAKKPLLRHAMITY